MPLVLVVILLMWVSHLSKLCSVMPLSWILVTNGTSWPFPWIFGMEGADLLKWNCIVEYLATLRDILCQPTSVQMLSMMSWSIDGRVEETAQDSPAVMSSAYSHLLGAEEATYLTSGAGIAERVSALDWLSLRYAAITTLPVSNPGLCS